MGVTPCRSCRGHGHRRRSGCGSCDFDWVQFKNGEWLKGEIKDLQDDSFTFDSDEMDELSLDFDDV